MPNFLDSAEEFLTATEESQVAQWAVEAGLWDEHHVYNIAAGLIKPQPRSIHVDFGCGFGHLLMHLKRSEPKCIGIGIDNNLSMLVAASALIEKEGFQYKIDAYRIIEEVSETVRRVYSASPDLQKQDLLKNKANPIFLLGDDIREPKALSHLLKGRKLDSASLTLPGSSLPAAYETPYEIELIDKTTTTQRINIIMDATRKAALKNTAQLVKPGGVFLMVERPPVYRHDPIVWTHNLIRSNLSGYQASDYWQPRDVIFLNQDFTAAGSPFVKEVPTESPSKPSDIIVVTDQMKSEIDLVAYGQGDLQKMYRENPREFVTTVVWSKLIRNDRPYQSAV